MKTKLLQTVKQLWEALVSLGLAVRQFCVVVEFIDNHKALSTEQIEPNIQDPYSGSHRCGIKSIMPESTNKSRAARLEKLMKKGLTQVTEDGYTLLEAPMNPELHRQAAENAKECAKECEELRNQLQAKKSG